MELLSAGCSANVKDYFGDSAWSLAQELGDSEMLGLIEALERPDMESVDLEEVLLSMTHISLRKPSVNPVSLTTVSPAP